VSTIVLPADLRALTLHRPWDWAILHAGKPVENRPQRPPKAFVGQWVALHSGLTYSEQGAEFIRNTFGLTVPADAELTAGAITGLMKLGEPFRADDLTATKDPWAFGPWCWRISDKRVLAKPVVCRGMQGLWRVPAAARADIEAQLAQGAVKHG
jgi:hypothetical protein